MSFTLIGYGERMKDEPPLEGASKWILVDAVGSGEVVVAAAEPSVSPRIDCIRRYPVEALTTFTDALMRFQQETGVKLDGSDCVIATTGVVAGGSVGLARSRWLITPQGLTHLFRRSATIINDGTARAWAALASRTLGLRIRGSSEIDLRRPGRRLLVIVDEGVGAAVIDTDSAGIVRVLETEAGHAGFAPTDPADDRLLGALRRFGAVSWEKVLLLSQDDPAWVEAAPRSSHAERLRLHARLLGSFVGDHVLAYGSWEGVLLVGPGVPHGLEANVAFDGGFRGQRSFRRQLAEVPCWKLDQPDYVMRGGLELLGHRHGVRMGRAA